MNGSALAFLVRVFYDEKNKTFQLVLPAERKKAPPPQKKKYQKRKTVSNARELMHAT